MAIVLWSTVAILCVGLCANGITTAVRRSADRREQGTRTDAALASAFHEVGGGCLLMTQGALSSRENAAV